MESPELSISVGELLGIPKVAIMGSMDGWHDQTVMGILAAFRDQGTTSLVLDIAALTFAGISGATGMIKVLRSLGPEICIHVVASGATAKILNRADLFPCIRLYSSMDEIAEYIPLNEDVLTSRWIASDADDAELPLAA